MGNLGGKEPSQEILYTHTCKDVGYAKTMLKLKARSQFTTLQIYVQGTRLSDFSRVFLSLSFCT